MLQGIQTTLESFKDILVVDNLIQRAVKKVMILGGDAILHFLMESLENIARCRRETGDGMRNAIGESSLPSVCQNLLEGSHELLVQIAISISSGVVRAAVLSLDLLYEKQRYY